MIYEKVSCKIDAHSFLLVECANIKHGMIFEKEAHFYTVWICCCFGLELLCKRDVQPSSIWNQAIIAMTLSCMRRVLLSSFETFSECECEVFCERGVHPFIKMDNCCVPLFHYFAVNLHNMLNCLEDGISMNRTRLSYSIWYVAIWWP